MTRTDIHRPKTVQPSDYTLIEVYDMGDWSGNRDPHYFGKDVDLLEARGHHLAEHLDPTYWAGTCGTCGQRGLVYVALVTHKVTSEFMVVGSTCIDSTFAAARDGLDAKQAAAAQARKEAKLLKGFNDAVAAEPVLAAAVAKLAELDAIEGFEWRRNEHTLRDMVKKCRQYGNGLSERQTSYVANLITWIDESISRVAKWAAEREVQQASASDAPTGRVVVTGKVIKAEWREGVMGSDTMKITVLTDAGYIVWCSLPSDFKYTDDMYTQPKDIKGKRIQMTVTLTPSEKDPKFAFGKIPKKASFVA